MTPVPEAVKAIGLLPTFSDKTGIEDQGLFMVRRDHLDNRRLVEGDKVKVSGVPPCKGPFVVRTVAAQIPKRRVAWEHQQKSVGCARNLCCGFLVWLNVGSTLRSSRMGVLPSRLYRITQPENRRTGATFL